MKAQLASIPFAALLALTACAAHAQSNVSVYGIVDLNIKVVKNDGSPRQVSMSQDGLYTSELGFRGVEDLGGGLRAGFNLVSTLNADTGTALGKFWNRRATVSLMSDAWGELRLGRDYVPTFWNNVIFDAFSTIGIAGSFNIWQLQAPYAASPVFGNVVRSDNAVGYFLPPNLGGLYGHVMAAPSENGSNQGRYLGLRLGYNDGRFSTGFSAGQQRFDAAANPAVTGITAGSHQTTVNAGASYNFGIAKLMGLVVHDARDGIKELRWSISAGIPVGVGDVRIAYHNSKLTNDIAHNSNTNALFGLGYVHNLSKRTALYTTAGWLQNGDHPLAGNTQSVAGFNALFAGNTQSAPTTVGGESRGIEFGLRHSF